MICSFKATSAPSKLKPVVCESIKISSRLFPEKQFVSDKLFLWKKRVESTTLAHVTQARNKINNKCYYFRIAIPCEIVDFSGSNVGVFITIFSIGRKKIMIAPRQKMAP